MDIALLVALWLHTVAFVIAWGYYGIVGRFVIPVLDASGSDVTRESLLVAIEKRALPFILLTVAIFVITGTYLLLVDDRYAGLGNFFASGWTVLMLVKHVVIVGLVAAAVWYDYLVRRLADIRRARIAAEIATGLGAVVALLTVAAQLSA